MATPTGIGRPEAAFAPLVQLKVVIGSWHALPAAPPRPVSSDLGLLPNGQYLGP